MNWALPLLLCDLNSGLVVETGSPDAHCPTLDQTQKAVSARLGTLEVSGEAGWRARYTSGHAPEQTPRDFVRLELYDPRGELRLTRDLPMTESCSTMAEVIALVLDRYFRDLASAERERPQGESETPVAPVPDRAPVPTPRATTEPEQSQPVLIAVELGVVSLRGPTAGVRFDAKLFDQIRWGLAGIWPFIEHSEGIAGGGRAVSDSFALHGYAGYGAWIGRFRPSVGPAVMAMLERGSTSDLPRTQAHYRVLGGAGLDAGVLWSPGASWLFRASGAVHAILPSSASFLVDGTEVLKPAQLFGYLGFGIGYAL